MSEHGCRVQLGFLLVEAGGCAIYTPLYITNHNHPNPNGTSQVWEEGGVRFHPTHSPASWLLQGSCLLDVRTREDTAGVEKRPPEWRHCVWLYCIYSNNHHLEHFIQTFWSNYGLEYCKNDICFYSLIWTLIGQNLPKNALKTLLKVYHCPGNVKHSPKGIQVCVR